MEILRGLRRQMNKKESKSVLPEEKMSANPEVSKIVVAEEETPEEKPNKLAYLGRAGKSAFAADNPAEGFTSGNLFSPRSHDVAASFNGCRVYRESILRPKESLLGF